METRSSHYEKLQNQRNVDNKKEMTNDENIQNFTPEFLSRPQRQHSPNKWMDEDEDFFYDLFAERTKTTKTTNRNSDPLCDPIKELSSTPLPQQPHKPKVVMRDLNEGKSTPASATREMCNPKTFAEVLGSKIDDGTLSIPRERRAFKYPKRLGIDDE